MTEQVPIIPQTGVVSHTPSMPSLCRLGSGHCRQRIIHVVSCACIIKHTERRLLLAYILPFETLQMLVVCLLAILVHFYNFVQVWIENFWLAWATFNWDISAEGVSLLFCDLHLICNLLLASWDIVDSWEGRTYFRWNGYLRIVQIDFVVVPVKLLAI